MIEIRTIEDLEAERDRQFKAWIEAGKEEDEFYLMLEGADLSGAKLTEANLSGADLTGAKLRGAKLTEAYLYLAKLSDANLTGSDLEGADLEWADLTGADLTGAKLSEAKTKNTIITQSQYDELANLYSHEFMDGFIIKELEVAE